VPWLSSNSPLHLRDGVDDPAEFEKFITERTLICVASSRWAILQRNHSSHQPFNQPAGGTPRTPAHISAWHNPMTDKHPRSTLHLPALCDVGTELPSIVPDVPYFISSTIDWSGDIALLLCPGRVRDGDYASQPHFLSNKTVLLIRIDTCVGGHEQDLTHLELVDDLMRLIRRTQRVKVITIESSCGQLSVVKFSNPADPKPNFTVDLPDGVLGPDGQLVEPARRAIFKSVPSRGLHSSVVRSSTGSIL
jgi:hypothetical protein